jgi:hypothetical protein
MIAALQGLMDELCAPDLTLGQAKALRPRLLALLEAMNGRELGASEGSEGTAEVESDRATATRAPETREKLHPEFPAFPLVLQRTCVG